MMRVQLARLTRPLRWSSPRAAARLFMAFARAERSSYYDMMAAAEQSPELTRRAQYLLHANDEQRHALMFTLHAQSLDAAVGGDPREQRADFERLFEKLGEHAFLAFVHCGELRGRRQLALYRDELAALGDDKGRALLDAVLVDEARHEHYTRQLLLELLKNEAAVRSALRRARLWELTRSWLRAGRAVGAGLFTLGMRATYLLLFPLAWIERLRLPANKAPR